MWGGGGVVKVSCRLCLCLHVRGVVEVQSSANDGGVGTLRALALGDGRRIHRPPMASFIKIIYF